MKNLLITFALCLSMALNAHSTATVAEIVPMHTVNKTDAFCTLIQKGNYVAVKTMIEAGADVNKKSNGLTPLMFAARQNKVEIVKLLLANGADIKLKGDRGYTALQWAKMTKAKDAYEVLLKEEQAQKLRKKAKRRAKKN
ncbi:ankyrin repeat domain-containing protein [Flavobacteriaceae bacterium F08102]|nr:ankyrin repeat domain-containing protein [Flavobacteriaceae bacterium F08102]